MNKQEYIDIFTESMNNSLFILEAMTDEEFTAFNLIHGDAVPELVKISDINVDNRYQRSISENRVKAAIKDYSSTGFQPISVGKRSDGTLYTNNGQHRTLIAKGVIDAFAEDNDVEIPDSEKYVMAWKRLNSDLLSECTGFDYQNRCSARPSQATNWRTMYIQAVHDWEGVTHAHIAVYNITNVFIRNGFGLGMIVPVEPNTLIDKDVELEEGVHFKYTDTSNNTSNVYQSIYNINRVLIQAIYNKGNTAQKRKNQALALSVLDMSLKVISQFPRKSLRMAPRILAGLIQFFYENKDSWSAVHSTNESKVSVISELFNHYTIDDLYSDAVKRNKLIYSGDGISDNTISSYRATADVIASYYMEYYKVSKKRGMSRTGIHTSKIVGNVMDFRNESIGTKINK